MRHLCRMLLTPLCLQHVKLKALIELKRLKLMTRQQQLRKAVASEQRLLTDCNSSTLIDWTLYRRADPEASEPDMTYKEPTPPPAPKPAISQAEQNEIHR